ncbi:MAG: hypothetical protein HQL32_08000 [Planctomycetes bacterium]|nr:hypothetical protein [Planctomycetota bacterium]
MIQENQFSQLSEQKRDQARQEMRREFSGILTAYTQGEEEHIYSLQLEVISVKAQMILNHRVMFVNYASDRPVLKRRLYLYYIAFVRGEKLPEESTYEELHVPDYDLWRIYNVLKKSEHGPSQVLHVDPAVSKIMGMPQFRPHLPAKLKDLDFQVINEREMHQPAPVSKTHQNLDALG